jgi:hypothetical protein
MVHLLLKQVMLTLAKMGHVAIQAWHNYLLATAGMATLTGLVFIAVSINLAQILTVPGLTSLAVDMQGQLRHGRGREERPGSTSEIVSSPRSKRLRKIGIEKEQI